MNEAAVDHRFEKTYPAWIKLAKLLETEGIPHLIYLRFLSEEAKWRPNTFASPLRLTLFWRWLGKKVSRAVLKRDKINILKTLSEQEDKARQIYDDYLASKLRLAYAGLSENSSPDDLVGVSDMISFLHLFELIQTNDIAHILPDTIFEDVVLQVSSLETDRDVRTRLIGLLKEGGHGERIITVLNQWDVRSPLES